MTLILSSAVRRGMAAPGVALTLAATCATTPVSVSAWRAATPSTQAAPVIAAQVDGWDTLTADITVRRGRRDARGRRVGPASQSVRYRLERTRVGSAWRTSLRMPSSDQKLLTLGGSVRTRPDRAVMRVESDPAGGPPRLFDATGAALMWPDAAAAALDGLPRGGAAATAAELLRTAHRQNHLPTPHPDAEGMGALVAARAADADRRLALERALGPSRGRIGARERFIVESSGHLREVLVDPASALPLEINDMQNGTLVAHRTFAYVDAPGGTVLRRAAQTEYAAADGSGERVTLDVELSNVRFERRR